MTFMHRLTGKFHVWAARLHQRVANWHMAAGERHLDMARGYLIARGQ